MLQLNYVLVSYKDLTKTERIRIACNGHDFGAILTDGILKVNKDLRKPKTLEKIVRKLFEIDHRLNCEDDGLVDRLYHDVRETWGSELWDQIWEAWGDTLDAKLAAEAKSEAAGWLARYGSDANIQYTDDLDEILDGVNPSVNGVMKAIYSAGCLRDVFNYGFQMGARYGAKEATEA